MHNRRRSLFLSIVFLFITIILCVADSTKFDVVIKNGRIVDGSGNPWFYADLGIIAGKIAKIGWIDTSEAAQWLDAKNLVVAPGFIDVHTHVEGGITRIPTADNFLQMGVTTIVTGNCGGSWLQIGDSLRALEARGISVNLATLIGHNTVRRAVLKDEAREPAPDELSKMQQLVEQAMRDGAVGLSTGLIYIPGTFAKTDEIIALAKIASQYKGVYASHIRNEGNEVVAAINEAIQIGEQAGLPVEISHFKISSKKLWGQSQLTTSLIQQARERGLQVTVDQYAYPASSTGLETQLPGWVLDGGREAAMARLRDAKQRGQIKKEMLKNLRQAGRKNYSHAFVANYRPDSTFNGKSIAEITKKLLRLEDAIRKMTSLPSQTFRFWDRGLIREGFAADLVIFDPEKVIDRATFEAPHQYPNGIRYVLVNGQIVVRENQHTGARAGKVLYGTGKI